MRPETAAVPQEVLIHIERLVVDGIAPAAEQEQAISEALRAELGRLMQAGGNGASGIKGTFRPPAHGQLGPSDQHGPAGIGVQIARSVHEGLSR
jgi:hypothetical protein